jgi:putative glutamine amidotransferase
LHPGLYGKAEEAGRCEDIDTHRDSLEELLIRSAFDMKMPVLGVCRGEQMINVFLGGTLWIDIPTDYRNEAGKPDTSVHHQCADYLTCFHGVTLVKGTTLSGIIGNENGSVTSNHHQAVRQMAPALKCNARSADGLVEGVEWNNPAGKSFLIGIQWHPERMDTSSAFSGKLAREFIRQAASFILSRNKITK